LFAVDDLHFQRALLELVVLECFALCNSRFCKYCFGGDVNLVFRQGRGGVKNAEPSVRLSGRIFGDILFGNWLFEWLLIFYISI
jgi:hypothetical protein